MARRYYSFAVAAALLVSGIAVAAAENSAVTPTTGASIRANSNGGLRLFRGATVVTPARVLQTETNTNDDDIPSFLADYSIRYNSCFDRLQFDTTGNIDNNSRDGGEGMLYTAHLVRFSLCPSTSCGPSCENGGEYVISMETFLDAYTESKLNGLEYACEMVRKACDCQDANDDFICESSCYMAAGLTGCEDAEGDGEMFEVQRFMECTGGEFLVLLSCFFTTWTHE